MTKVKKQNLFNFYFINFFIVQLFIERNQKIKDEKHNSVLKKLMDTEMRHTFNLGKLNEENEKLEQENREKALRKYTAVVKKNIFLILLFFILVLA